MSCALPPAVVTTERVLPQTPVHRGDFTLGPVSLQIDRADRVAITGANGSGKSTLLSALLGRIPLDTGHQALGSGVVIGEIDHPRAVPRT
ncbi:hypothetical protein GCM10009837_68640 [Streptomyces durmitorensis]